jgi:hypothetical protein
VCSSRSGLVSRRAGDYSFLLHILSRPHQWIYDLCSVVCPGMKGMAHRACLASQFVRGRTSVYLRLLREHGFALVDLREWATSRDDAVKQPEYAAERPKPYFLLVFRIRLSGIFQQSQKQSFKEQAQAILQQLLKLNLMMDVGFGPGFCRSWNDPESAPPPMCCTRVVVSINIFSLYLYLGVFECIGT